jgi:hypothetical protein
MGLSTAHSYARRLLFSSMWFQNLFRDKFKLSEERSQAEVFENQSGGCMQAVSTGSKGDEPRRRLCHLRRFKLSRRRAQRHVAEGGASDQTVMEIAGRVSRKMLEHYGHARIPAKRAAIDALGKVSQGTAGQF